MQFDGETLLSTASHGMIQSLKQFLCEGRVYFAVDIMIEEYRSGLPPSESLHVIGVKPELHRSGSARRPEVFRCMSPRQTEILSKMNSHL